MAREQTASTGLPWAEIQEYDAPTKMCWNFDYTISVDKLENLYRKAVKRQWDGDAQLNWDHEIDPSKPIVNRDSSFYFNMPFFKKLSKTQQDDFSAHQTAHTLSQITHGEQGALMTAATITHSVPDYDAKLYSASQTIDEARHVEVYERYVNKIAIAYPITEGLKGTIDTALQSGHYIKIMIGMNMIIESLALAAFHNIRMQTSCPLLKDLVTYVLQDEARHVAFGNVYLSHVIEELHPDEREDISDFVYGALKGRFTREKNAKGGRVFDPTFAMMLKNVGIDPDDFSKGIDEAYEQGMRLQNTAGSVNAYKDLAMPSLFKIGAITPRVRQKFEDEGIPIWEDDTILNKMAGDQTGEFTFEDDDYDPFADEEAAEERREDEKLVAQVTS